MKTKDALIKKLHEKKAKIGILGMGYVGMPLAVVFAEKGFNVLGIDPDKRKLETFGKGFSYIRDVSNETVARLKAAGKLSMSNDFASLAQMDAVSICVPTPLRKTGDPDMSYIVSATEQLAKYVHKGMVVVLESTTYPGTTRELMSPMLTDKSGLKVGEDIFICFSPERVDPGREDWTTFNTPKVLGGMTKACAEVATAWYAGAIETVVPG
jgi:UDP-N-acetyl-D-glucosamine dehydrogenase